MVPLVAAFVIVLIAMITLSDCKRRERDHFVGDYVRSAIGRWRAPVASALESLTNAIKRD